VGDLDRQQAVAQAANGCFIAVLALALVTLGSAIVALTSTLTVILAALLILSGLVLGVVAWAEQG
jgi:hypothetical protein